MFKVLLLLKIFVGLLRVTHLVDICLFSSNRLAYCHSQGCYFTHLR